MKRKAQDDAPSNEALRRRLVNLQRRALVADAATQLALYREMQAIRHAMGK